MALQTELRGIEGRKRKFLLLRIVGIESEPARQLCLIPKGTYNSWFHHDSFVEANRKVTDWSGEYKQEAIQLLRRTTQLQAALLEEQIYLSSKIKTSLVQIVVIPSYLPLGNNDFTGLNVLQSQDAVKPAEFYAGETSSPVWR